MNRDQIHALLVTHDLAKNEDKDITRDDAIKDLDLLTYMLKNGYAGTKHMPKAQFLAGMVEIEKISNNLPQTIRATEFAVKVGQAVSTIPDRHLSVRFAGKKMDYRPEIVANVGENFGKNKKAIWEFNFIQGPNGSKIPVLSIHQFPTSSDPIWKGYHEAVERQLKTAHYFVVDLRGNDGGDDTQGGWLAERLWGGTPKSPYSKTYECRTPECLSASINMYVMISNRYRADKSTVPLSIEEGLASYRKKLDQALADQLPAEEIIPADRGSTPFDPIRGFNRPVFILVDRKCVSSGESTLANLRMHPMAQVIGENTGGLIHFGNQGLFELPHSGIEVRLGTHFNEDYRGEYYEMLGYPPDLAVPAGQDAMDSVKKIISQSL